jgi:FkbM family methyltransferase
LQNKAVIDFTKKLNLLLEQTNANQPTSKRGLVGRVTNVVYQLRSLRKLWAIQRQLLQLLLDMHNSIESRFEQYNERQSDLLFLNALQALQIDQQHILKFPLNEDVYLSSIELHRLLEQLRQETPLLHKATHIVVTSQFNPNFLAPDACLEAWYHVDFEIDYDTESLLAQVKRRLKPQGVFVLISDCKLPYPFTTNQLVTIADFQTEIRADVSARVIMLKAVNTTPIQTISGFEILANVDDPGPISYHLQQDRTWETETTSFLQAHLQPGHVFVDIGANIGYFSKLAAERVTGTGHVIAIEPDPENAAILRANLAHSAAQINVIEAAAGENRGVMQLYRSPLNNGDHRVFDVPNGDLLYDGGVPRHLSLPVTVERIDDVLAAYQYVHVIKIDVQGYEIPVLRGMLQVMQRLRPMIIIEFWPYGLQQAGFQPEEVAIILRNAGYTLFQLTNQLESIILDAARIAAIPTGEFLNIVACYSDCTSA